jgi:hypothetical protein
MHVLSPEQVLKYRAKTFRSAAGERVKSRDEAVEFVNQRGFVFFWPIQGVTMPSLWVAVAGDRPVADQHDDPGHVTWGWKDALLGSRAWYYAKVLRKKATMISMAVLPYFYALSENYGSPEEDYLTLYEQGRLTLEAKAVYEAVLEKGPLDTIALRKAAHLSSPGSEARFNKALADLQADFKLVPIAVAEVGAWHYAFVYEVVARHYPELPALAQGIRERQARQKLAHLYLRSVGAAQINELVKLFGWSPDVAQQTVEGLAQAGAVRLDVKIEGSAGEWIAVEEIW